MLVKLEEMNELMSRIQEDGATFTQLKGR